MNQADAEDDAIVRRVVGQYLGAARACGLDRDDMHQAGWLAVLQARAGWDAARGPWPPYAYGAARNGIRAEFKALRRAHRARLGLMAEMAADGRGGDIMSGGLTPECERIVEAAKDVLLSFEGIERRAVMLHWGLDGAEPLTQLQTARALGIGRGRCQRICHEAEKRMGALVNQRAKNP